MPTWTVMPIITDTMRFTATLPPSATLEPSATLMASNTPIPPTPTNTLSPTPSPTFEGQSISASRVNVRDADGEIVGSVPSNGYFGVLDAATFDFTSASSPTNCSEWFLVYYLDFDVSAAEETADEESETPTPTIVEGWMCAELVRTDFASVAVEVDEDTATETAPAAVYTPFPTPQPGELRILADCNQGLARNRPAAEVEVPEVTTSDRIYVWWSWYVVDDPGLMDDHLAYATYEIELNGSVLSNWRSYASDTIQNPNRSSEWFVYWNYPIENLPAGEYDITYSLTWERPVWDGEAWFGPAEEFGPGQITESLEGDCQFTVVEAEQ
ncbi:MAG: hypothetical protein GYB65_10990 [Chloroflexi bacterium]|nr:hypothetical protein [Chloroflexota bacterium]